MNRAAWARWVRGQLREFRRRRGGFLVQPVDTEALEHVNASGPLAAARAAAKRRGWPAGTFKVVRDRDVVDAILGQRGVTLVELRNEEKETT